MRSQTIKTGGSELPDVFRCKPTGALLGRWLEGVLLTAALARATVEVACAPRWTVDDAWIVVRYAENFVRHGAFSYNLEGPRVEGFTSPLYAMLSVASVALGISAVPVAKALGILTYLASGTLLVGFARELRAPAPVGAIVAFAYMAVPDHISHAASALETEVYLGIQIVCAWAFARALRGTAGKGLLALVGACALAAWTRPEGIVVAGLLLGVVAVRLWRRHGGASSDAKRRFVRLVALGFAPGALALAGRLMYFRSLLPNTFFAKRAALNAAHLRDVAELTNSYFLDLAILGAGTLMLARLLGVPHGRVGPRRTVVLIASVALLATYGSAYSRSDLIMNYGHRFAMHGLPWLAAALVVFLGHVASRLVYLRKRAPIPAAFLAGAALLLLWACVLNGEPQRSCERVRMASYEDITRTRYLPVVDYLAAHLPNTATLAVYPDAGFVPYRSRLRTLDFGRLNDLYLARYARTPPDVARYFFASAPDALMASYVGRDRLWDEGEAAILQDSKFDARYEVALRNLTSSGGGIILYVRKP